MANHEEDNTRGARMLENLRQRLAETEGDDTTGKRERILAAGHRVGGVQELLDLTNEEMELIELKRFLEAELVTERAVGSRIATLQAELDNVREHRDQLTKALERCQVLTLNRDDAVSREVHETCVAARRMSPKQSSDATPENLTLASSDRSEPPPWAGGDEFDGDYLVVRNTPWMWPPDKDAQIAFLWSIDDMIRADERQKAQKSPQPLGHERAQYEARISALEAELAEVRSTLSSQLATVEHLTEALKVQVGEWQTLITHDAHGGTLNASLVMGYAKYCVDSANAALALATPSNAAINAALAASSNALEPEQDERGNWRLGPPGEDDEDTVAALKTDLKRLMRSSKVLRETSVEAVNAANARVLDLETELEEARAFELRIARAVEITELSDEGLERPGDRDTIETAVHWAVDSARDYHEEARLLQDVVQKLSEALNTAAALTKSARNAVTDNVDPNRASWTPIADAFDALEIHINTAMNPLTPGAERESGTEPPRQPSLEAVLQRSLRRSVKIVGRAQACSGCERVNLLKEERDHAIEMEARAVLRAESAEEKITALEEKLKSLQATMQPSRDPRWGTADCPMDHDDTIDCERCGFGFNATKTEPEPENTMKLIRRDESGVPRNGMTNSWDEWRGGSVSSKNSDERLTVRQAARLRRPIGVANAQALEGALTQVEQELDFAKRAWAREVAKHHTDLHYGFEVAARQWGLSEAERLFPFGRAGEHGRGASCSFDGFPQKDLRKEIQKDPSSASGSELVTVSKYRDTLKEIQQLRSELEEIQGLSGRELTSFDADFDSMSISKYREALEEVRYLRATLAKVRNLKGKK